MKANCWMGSRHVEVRDVPDPKILNPRDAIVRITSTAICGSDLHLYNGFVPTMRRGDVLGHEFMGEVVEVGRGVSHLAPGDRVVVRRSDHEALFLHPRGWNYFDTLREKLHWNSGSN